MNHFESQSIILANERLIQPMTNEIIELSSKQREKIEPRMMRVLLYLIEKKGEVVKRSDLISDIWENEFVGDDALTQTISRLRKVLNDRSSEVRFIQTIPKVGYKLVCEIEYILNRTDVRQKNKTRIWLSSLVGILLLVSVVMITHSPNEYNYKLNPIVQLTSDIGRESYPAFSPDGNFIVYSKRSKEDKKLNLYLYSIVEKTNRRLSQSDSDDLNPVWSPDGQFIAYLRLHNGKSDIVLLQARQQGILEKGEHLITTNSLSETKLAWFADSKNLLYSDKEESETYLSLNSINIETKRVKRLPRMSQKALNSEHATISENGKNIIFSRRLNQSSAVYSISSTSGEAEKELLNFDSYIYDLNYFGNDAVIICGANKKRSGLWFYDIQKDHLTWLGAEKATKFSVNYLRGRLVHSKREYNIDLHFADLSKDSLNSKTLFSSTKTEWQPKISPNKKKLLFISDRTGQSQLWIVDLDKMEERQLTHDKNNYVANASFSPDGKLIVYECVADDIASIYLMNVETGIAQALVMDGNDNRNPTWSADAKTVYFQSNKSNLRTIWRISLETKNRVQVTRVPSVKGMPSVDERFIFFTRSDRKNGLWKQEINENSLPEKAHNFPYIMDAKNWQLINNEFIYKQPVYGSNEIMLAVYNFSTNKIKNLYKFKAVSVSYLVQFDLSNDRTQLVYSNLESLDSDLFLSEIVLD
jgi:Tol biopolymer transport system component/DNA-binding winged helix-turn-helix (wHTH) protein